MNNETRSTRRSSNRPFWKSWKLWVLVIFVLAIVVGISSCLHDFKKETAAPATKIYKLDSNGSVKAMLKHYVSELKFSDINGSYEDTSNKTVAVTIKESGDDATDKMAVRNMYSDILKTWNAFKRSKAEKFKNISISVSYPMTSRQITVIKTNLSGSKLAEFNKKKMSAVNVPSFADSFWKHNSLPDVK